MTISVGSADARKRWSEVLEQARHEPVAITSRGRERAVLIDPELYARAMSALEDAEDAADGLAAEASGDVPIPWEQVQRDLGLLA